MSLDWNQFVEVIRASRRVLVTSHIRPDCDALGSELGLTEILEYLGKEVRIVNGDPTPANLAFIDPGRRIHALAEQGRADPAAGADLVVVLDTSAWAQLGPMGDVLRSPGALKIVLDHHVSEDDLGALAFKDVTASATGCLVLEAADHLQVPLSESIARSLFTAMATDTGWFRFASADPRTYRYAARLIEAGAQPAEIYAQLYEQETAGRVRLRGVVLSRVELEMNGRLVHTYVKSSDFPATGAEPPDTEDAINLTLAIAGTEVAVIIVEQLSGGSKISFRSRGGLDCSQIASQFGGGGHKAAAGAFVDAPLAEAQQLVLPQVRQAMAQMNHRQPPAS